MNKRRVVVTGLGVVTSLGLDVDEVWEKLVAGTSGVCLIQRFDTSQYASKIAGEISDWDGGLHIEPREMKRIDRFSQFGLNAAIDAVADSGIDFSSEDDFRCGVIVGSGIGGIETFCEGDKKLLFKGPNRISPMMIPRLMVNAGSGNIAIRFGLRGVNYSVVTACASAGHAIGDAYRSIVCDEADVIISGGAEAAAGELGTACFTTMRALSTRNDEPEKASRPFDRDRDGFVIAEGAGMVVLEEYEHAKKRGAKIYGEVLGYGMTCDSTHITAPDETGVSARHAMKVSLKMAKLDVTDIGYINPHATSTKLGDMAENAAVKGLFGDHAYKTVISSTKSMTGHLLGASGGVELVILAKVLETGDVPPTINLDNPDEGFDLNYVPHEAQHHDVKYCMSNNFGFGGHNVSLVMGKV